MATDMTSDTFRAIIVDDERPARKELELLLRKHPEIIIVGEADTINSAIDLIDRLKPNIVFLDIELTGENGFDLLPKINCDLHIIFVTAYNEYALRAFEVNSLDYLLKPVNPKRLEITIDRIKSETTSTKIQTQLNYGDTIFISDRNSSMFLKIKNIAAIESNGDYSIIWSTDDKKHTVLSSLKSWEKRLPSNEFKRVHKASIVNINCIDRIYKGFNNNHKIVLKNSDFEIEMSRRYYASYKTNFR